MQKLACLLLLAVGLLLDGCGQPTSRPEAKKYPVRGTVTLDGQPMPEGSLYFKTIATGALDFASIKDGKFEGQAQEGDRRVEISCTKSEVQESGGMKTEVQKELIPAKYNTDPSNTLQAAVSPKGPNQFTFELTSK